MAINTELIRGMIRAAAVMAGFAGAGTLLVATAMDITRERIVANERDALLRTLSGVLPAGEYDNAVHEDFINVQDPELLGTAAPVTVYRARRGGVPIVAVLTPVAPAGYNGAIRLLVGIRADGRLSGVRVLGHRETPGLGDRIEVERDDWILGFSGLSLLRPPREHWAVKKDDGVFDQFTGATVTPRAVVMAVRDALVYFDQNKDALFATPTGTTGVLPRTTGG